MYWQLSNSAPHFRDCVPTQVPEAHLMYLKTGNMSWELEQQVSFHAAAVEYQLGQLYHGFSLAVALNRTFVLPEVSRSPTLCVSEYGAEIMLLTLY